LRREADIKEYFIKHFMEEGCTKARLDKRKLVTYKDMGKPPRSCVMERADELANVVARSEEFEFLRGTSTPTPL
jgi:DNA polymerase epsilon subunit 4